MLHTTHVRVGGVTYTSVCYTLLPAEMCNPHVGVVQATHICVVYVAHMRVARTHYTYVLAEQQPARCGLHISSC